MAFVGYYTYGSLITMLYTVEYMVCPKSKCTDFPMDELVM